MLLPDRSSRERFGSFSGQEQALHRSHRSLDWFDRLRRILAALQVVCNLFGRPRPYWCVGLGSSSMSTMVISSSSLGTLVLVPDRSSQEKFGSVLGQKQALHRPYRSLD